MTAPENVLWIGGSSGSGKSTVARLLARRHGLRWYSCDTRTWEHRDRAIAAGDPAAIEWEGLSPDQRSELSVADTMRLAVDRSAMVLDDVAALPDEPAVVAEGTNVMPAMVPATSPAIWLTAQPTVRAARSRGRGWGAAGGEVDLIRERQLHAALHDSAVMIIDTSTHADPYETITQIESTAAAWLANCPAAQSRRERQSLTRKANRAIVAQYRGGMARAGNTEGGSLVRTYDCECGDTDCTDLIERPLGSFPDPFGETGDPILAPDHQQAPP